MPVERVTIGKIRRGCDIFSDFRILPCLHDWRKIKGHWALKTVFQVGGWFNVFLAIYDVILFQKKGTE